jgi:hypothetical protein
MNREDAGTIVPAPKQEWFSEYAIKSVSPRARVIRNPNRRIFVPKELVDAVRLLTKRMSDR